MVKIIQKSNKVLYQCEECGLQYADKEIAEKCQAWCGKHKSCNLDLMKYAVQDPEEKAVN